MANLVENKLIITGELANELGRKFFDEGMEYFIPMPKYLLEDFLLETARTSEPAWMEWAYDTWGTKWDIYKEQREINVYGPKMVEVTFLTSNETIAPFCNFLSETYPGLRLELFSREEFEENFEKLQWFSDNSEYKEVKDDS